MTVPSFERVITALLCDQSTAMPGASPDGVVIKFRAAGSSMYPAIRDGELITVGQVTAGQIVRGDVLLCRQSGRLLAHRVVEVAANGTRHALRLRGDAKRASDAPIVLGDVIGKVISVQRNGRAIPMCGRAARLRHTVRAAASRAKGWLSSGRARARSSASMFA